MNTEAIIVAAVFTFLVGIAAGAWLLIKLLGYYVHTEVGRKTILGYFEKHKNCPLYEGNGLTHRLTNHDSQITNHGA